MTAQTFLDGKVTLLPGDCREVLATLPEASVDAIVTDPPYLLEFMGKAFDKQHREHEGANDGQRMQAWHLSWAVEAYRVLKPGGHIVAFAGDRTFHRLYAAIEDAGFIPRHSIAWIFGSGFPKSTDISKQIDKAAGVEREIVGVKPNYHSEGRRAGTGFNQHGVNDGSFSNPEMAALITAPTTDAARQWQGWGTQLKPAMELIALARKPLSEKTVAANVLVHGTGALNIDGCRVETEERPVMVRTETVVAANAMAGVTTGATSSGEMTTLGRWPANLVHDGSDEVVACFPDVHGAGAARDASQGTHGGKSGMFGLGEPAMRFGDSGSAARFFYTAKADAQDRLGSKHPTVKPIDLMQWLCRLVTPPGGIVLDCFAGTGTTGEAAWREGFRAILIEREPEYQADIARRMELATRPTKRAAVAKTKNKLDKPEDLPLFGDSQ